MSYRIGIDIGIASVGWAVISGKQQNSFIEDFGVRIFDSEEVVNKKDTKCQGRRKLRGARRLERRRVYRKMLLRNHFENIGLLNSTFEDDLLEIKDSDVYELKVKGLDEQLSPAELYKCLVHTCNHRGYRDFYEMDQTENDEEIDETEGKNKQAVSEFGALFASSGKRTVSEYLISANKEGDFVKYRNKNSGDNPYLLINRALLEDEVKSILKNQSRYYNQLNSGNIDMTVKIIFNQRDFEDGPGDPNDPTRRYTGFIESLGKCPFYANDKRGFRSTVISDVFAVTNTLSQYRFINKETGEFELNPSVAKEIVDSFLKEGSISLTDVKRILKSRGYELQKSEKSDDKGLSKAVKYVKSAKKCIEDAGHTWQEFISENQFDCNSFSRLHRIGEIISKYQTPSRRVKELKKLGFLDDALIKAFSTKKISGTAAAGYRYMCDAIEAFLHGETYGNFQANVYKNPQAAVSLQEQRYNKLPYSVCIDEEIQDNTVVLRAVNETRKIVNAIISIYGQPDKIIIEVASDLGRSFRQKQEIANRQKQNEKNNESIRKEISQLLSIDEGDVTSLQMDKYKLYHQQSQQSLYSGKKLGDIKDVLVDTFKQYEVDHIVPYSLILDNTIDNKALVYARENQEKGQRTPLMYLSGNEKEEYKKRVNNLYARDNTTKGKAKNDSHYPPFNLKKYNYLRLNDLYSSEARELLDEWKTRNINDTRYITKYISGKLEKYLNFTDNDAKNVYSVKGTITSHFRRIWLEDTPWGNEIKDRSTYLNHACDAVVLANLSNDYIEIASDAIKLRTIYKRNRHSTQCQEYKDYFKKCVDKMEKYYHFSRAYTERLLMDPETIPSYIPRLAEEVAKRFNDSDKAKFEEDMKQLYGNCSKFILPPHMPITSHKQSSKFKGEITDSNPIKLVDVDGKFYKVVRKPVSELTASVLERLYTEDESLKRSLHAVLDGKGEKYTLEKYLTEKGMKVFTTDCGQPVRMVSVREKNPVTNYYRKQISENNYSYLGGVKYWCVEVYKTAQGTTNTRGIRFVDIVKENGKLYIKAESYPADYKEHVIYLFQNDYLVVLNNKNEIKFEGRFKAVYNINENRFSGKCQNDAEDCDFRISSKDTVRKYDISILGRKGGEIRCSEPLSSTTEKK